MDLSPHPSSSATETTPATATTLSCPSAPADWPGARIFGVACGSNDQARIAYLDDTIAFSAEWAERTAPVETGEVLRITAPCAAERCQHYAQERCQLVNRTLRYLQAVVDRPPVCAIRNSCRWWHEHGKDACLRCPQVVTLMFPHREEVVRAATPEPASLPTV